MLSTQSISKIAIRKNYHVGGVLIIIYMSVIYMFVKLIVPEVINLLEKNEN